MTFLMIASGLWISAYNVLYIPNTFKNVKDLPCAVANIAIS